MSNLTFVAEQKERMEKDRFLFTEKKYDFANPGFHCNSQFQPDMVAATPMIRLNPPDLRNIFLLILSGV